MVKIGDILELRLTQRQQRVLNHLKANRDEVYSYDEMKKIGKEHLGIKTADDALLELLRLNMVDRVKIGTTYYFQTKKIIAKLSELLRISRRLAQEYGREPTPKEIGQEMERSPQKVREIAKVSQLPISLESPIGEEEDSHLGDFIEDRDALPPVDAASKQLLKEQIDDVLSTLTPREQRVLELRFGLEDGRSRTLEEVGKEFNVTRERIRQIEAKALRKLRHPSRSRRLKDYLE